MFESWRIQPKHHSHFVTYSINPKPVHLLQVAMLYNEYGDPLLFFYKQQEINSGDRDTQINKFLGKTRFQQFTSVIDLIVNITFTL